MANVGKPRPGSVVAIAINQAPSVLVRRVEFSLAQPAIALPRRKVLGVRKVDDSVDTAAASRIWDGLA